MNVAYGRCLGWTRRGIGTGNKHNEDWILRVGERGTGNSESRGGFLFFVLFLGGGEEGIPPGGSPFNMEYDQGYDDTLISK